MERFLYGLGIRHVGEETALLLAKQLRITNYELQINDIVKYFQNIKLEDLEELPDVGPIMAKSIYDWFRDEHNSGILKKLEENGVKLRITNYELRIINKKLENKIFVLTGALNGLTRDEAKAKIRELGGNVSSSVSKNTDFVLAGTDPGGKYKKAKKLGVKIINEKEFLKMIK